MDSYLTISEAARLISSNQQDVDKLVQSGTIRAIMHNGVALVNQNDVLASLPVEDRPEFKKYAHLLGTKIMVSDVAEKYGVSHVNVLRWIKRGLIPVLQRGPGRSVFVDEAHAAYCAEVYRANKGQGRWLFNPDGTPYIKR